MRQHNKVQQGSKGNARRNVVRNAATKAMKDMDLPSPLTKKERRIAFCEARKCAKREYKKNKRRKR